MSKKSYWPRTGSWGWAIDKYDDFRSRAPLRGRFCVSTNFVSCSNGNNIQLSKQKAQKCLLTSITKSESKNLVVVLISVYDSDFMFPPLHGNRKPSSTFQPIEEESPYILNNIIQPWSFYRLVTYFSVRDPPPSPSDRFRVPPIRVNGKLSKASPSSS
jgi:hypothetical protein